MSIKALITAGFFPALLVTASMAAMADPAPNAAKALGLANPASRPVDSTDDKANTAAPGGVTKLVRTVYNPDGTTSTCELVITPQMADGISGRGAEQCRAPKSAE